MTNSSERKNTLLGGWQSEAAAPLAPAPVESRPAPLPEILGEPRESGVVPVPAVAAPDPSVVPASPLVASGDEKLPASSKSRAPTGTLLKPAGAQTQAMQAARFDEVQRDLNEKRARRARIDNVVRWGTGLFVGIAFVLILLYLATH